MKTVFVNACARPNSRTKILADAVLRKIAENAADLRRGAASLPVSGAVKTNANTEPAAGAGDTIEEVRLYEAGLKPMDNERLRFRDRCIAAHDFSDPMFDAARMLASADRLVIAAPFWDLSYPAVLKTYIENVMVTGLVFRYREDGSPESLCHIRRLVYVSTAGGPVFENMGYKYVSMIAEYFFGVPGKNISLVQAENLDIDGADVDAILAGKLREIERMSF